MRFHTQSLTSSCTCYSPVMSRDGHIVDKGYQIKCIFGLITKIV